MSKNPSQFMQRLRNSLVILIFLIGFFLNIERLDFGAQADVVNIQSFVYILVAFQVFAVLFLTSYWRPSDLLMVMFWVTVYLVLKVVFFAQRPVFGGVYTYLTATEILMVGSITWATYRVAKNIYDYEDTIATVTLGDVSDRVKRLDQAQDDITKELARSRRYDSPLSLVVLRVRPEDVKFNVHRSAEEILQGMMKRYTANRLIRMLDRDLRRSDLVIDQPRDDYVTVLLPETSKEGTEILVNRIREVAREQLGLDLSCGYSTFPRDALTFEDLLLRAEDQFRPKQLDNKPRKPFSTP